MSPSSPAAAPSKHVLTHLARSALELAGISRRFLLQSRIYEDLVPKAVGRLLSQVVRGLRGPMAVVRLHAFAAPERLALVSDTVRLSYGEFDARVNRVAHGLSALGIGPDDRVGLMLDNGHEFIESVAALGYLGATAVQIGYRLKPKEVAYILTHAGVKGLIFHQSHAEVIQEARKIAGGPKMNLCILAGGDLLGPVGFPHYEELAQRGDGRDPPYVRDGGYASLMLYTSGTTGKSKGARRDLSTTQFASVVAMLADLPLYRDDRHLCLCPLYHAAAPAFTAFVFAVGGAVFIPRRFEPEKVLLTIERERITSSVMVPTMMHRILDLPEKELRRYDTGSLRWLMSVAAPLPTDLARRVEEHFGPVLFNMYGATETGLVTLARPGEHTARPGTIGRRIFGNDIRLVSADGRDVPPSHSGQVGEMYVKNGTLVVGYHNDDQATFAAQRDGYFTVGDLAYRDEDGYYYLADRKSDMVISAGVNIYPMEIEQRLHDHPAVFDCAVVGVPDPDWGESLVAFVVPTKDHARKAGPELAAELRAFVGQELADYKRPRRIEFVEEIPRNPTGKIMKRELRQRLADVAGRNGVSQPT
jgi:fatty-acyl-CoA synthase